MFAQQLDERSPPSAMHLFVLVNRPLWVPPLEVPVPT